MCAKPVSTEESHFPAQEAGAGDSGEVLAGWLRASGAGDAQAFRLFYEATVRKVYGLAYSIVRSHQTAEDVIIDVYLRAWRSAAHYDDNRGGSLGWLMTICRNCAISALEGLQATGGQAPAEAVVGKDASELIAAFEEGGRVRKALAELPAVERQIVALAFFRGLSHSRIAEVVRLPLGTVKTHIRKALVRLRARLSQ